MMVLHAKYKCVICIWKGDGSRGNNLNMEEIKYISMKADITFKALRTLGNNEVKK